MSIPKKTLFNSIGKKFKLSFLKEKIKELYLNFISGNSSKFVLFLILLGGLILIFFPYIFVNFSWFDFGQDKPGEIGDIINGVTAPFIGFGAIIVTFYAFWIQFKANIALRKDFEFSKFENKYYELLRLHRENVAEMNINNIHTGRKVFVVIYGELKFAFYFVKSVTQTMPEGDDEKNFGFDKNNDEVILKIAYLLYFHGYGYNPDKLLLEPLNQICSDQFVTTLLGKVTMMQNDYLAKKENAEKDNAEKENAEKKNAEIVTLVVKLKEGKKTFVTDYIPFNGHMMMLGHYYRHLYQTVKFIAEFDKIPLTYEEKYSYLKMLRAQLSSHEQVLLYYNSLSYFGGKWLDKKHPYLTEYMMIKNLPLPLADFGITPEKKFENEINSLKAKGEELFEWHEQEKSNSKEI